MEVDLSARSYRLYAGTTYKSCQLEVRYTALMYLHVYIYKMIFYIYKRLSE